MTPLLEIKSVSLRIPQAERTILEDISYTVHPGDMVIVLGGNGSGKSSLLKLIDKRYAPTKGTIFYQGRSIKQISASDYYRSVKTLTQSTAESLFLHLTILENVRLFNRASKNATQHEFASLSQLSDYLAAFNPQLASKLHQEVRFFSGGERQALVLAVTMLNPPHLLLLDEHTSALDPKSADVIMALTYQLIQKHHITCLLTTHDLALAATYGDRLLALKEGKLYRALERDEKLTMRAQDLRDLCY
jgi:putative ABC transport system ATP-binding protein